MIGMVTKMAKLKLVSSHSSSTSRIEAHDIDLQTRTDSVDPENYFGPEIALSGKDASEYWRDYSLFHHSVKTVYRNSQLFSACLIKWKKDTAYSSSLSDIVMHPSYQRIIGIGPDAVPFILQELAENGGHWFWALQALTGENPVQEEDFGRIKKMKEAWLSWGRARNLVEL